MTDEQIDQLRALIQCEVEYALQEENGYMWSYERKEINDAAWKNFKETFNNED